MKLLFTQDALVNAGAERSHLEILSRFSKDVNVGFVYFYPKDDLKEAYKRAGIRLFFLGIPESYHFPLAISRLVRLIKQEKPDLLISSLWRADIITRIASLLTRVPLVGTLVNDSYGPMAWKDKSGWKHRLVHLLDKWTSGIPVHWIANAQALADSHVETLGIERKKVSVVYRGRPVIAANVIAREARPKHSPIDTTNSEKDRFPDLSGQAVPREDETRVIASYEGAKQSPHGRIASPADGAVLPMKDSKGRLAMTRNFISYGRLLERKGFQDAIQAFSEILKTYPDCTLTIFGEGPYRIQLEKLIQELNINNSVFLPGKTANPIEKLLTGYYLPTDHSLLITANYFLFPSWYEGFSGALVEAMMAGIPIIASDIPMNLEAIQDHKSALVFPVANQEILAEKMIFAIENSEQMASLGAKAMEEAVARFDIEKIAKQYEGVLKSILPHPDPPLKGRERK